MPKCYLTAGVTQDGLGARLQRIICLMEFTLLLRNKLGIDVDYLHTPLSYEGFGVTFFDGEHLRGGVTYPKNLQSRDNYMAEAKVWDAGIEYASDFVWPLSDMPYKYSLSEFWKDYLAGKLDGIYVVNTLHLELDTRLYDINRLDVYKDHVRKMFNFNHVGHDIAIHIRRQDAIGERHLPDEYYLDLIKHIREAGLGMTIGIYTQREGFDASLYDCEVVYDDIEQDFVSLSKLINAKILVMGHSSFSYVAGLLNPNIVVHHNRGHIPLKRWMDRWQFINYLKHGRL